ncbi:uncharacterized protein LOC124949809 [Vespa velutina]|uniref:uncharacterized protein LOC124949809 n=1 Tax=Vespa velutina TaxID=202808 RepID=UPI001FB28DBF|nr:uncharacterized protein LOC124949809 [Vespa velutina]XP_047351494.1 uncharacterized protein LOC124949809 [Vespa velutina]XP_047351503.1 uncharacterized protein LOC124949809 [Vespa velutina]
MSNVSGISKEETIIKGKPTLVRRVSNMFKDGNYSRPPLLFRHASMQKLRHCCQNLNLFPYLLYSYDNSKSHPVAKKVNVCISELLRSIAERFFYIYKYLRCTSLYGNGNKNNNNNNNNVIYPKKSSIESKKGKGDEADLVIDDEERKPIAKFQRQERQRQKQIPFFLILAVYLVPLILAFEMIIVCSLLIFDKYTPGFVFLISAVIFLAYIAFRIFFYESKTKKSSSNGANNRYARVTKKTKVQ